MSTATIVGSGPNGLVAAAVLAESGWQVTVLEAADRHGGGLRTEELTLPGFRHDLGATVHAILAASPAFRALGLHAEGLRLAHPRIPLAHPLTEGGRSAYLHRGLAETAAGLGADSLAWRAVPGVLGHRWEALVSGVLDPLALPPRTPVTTAFFGAAGLAPATWVNRLVFREEPARALLAGLAAHATVDLGQPLTTAIGLLLGSLAHEVGWPVAVGGSQSVADALTARIRARGGEVVTGHRVRSVDELPPTDAVLLDLTPRQVLAVAGHRFPAGYRARLARWRYGAGVFKVDWALDGPVPWQDPQLSGAGTLHLVGSAAEAVTAERTVMRGGVPSRPYVLAVQACVADPSRAPAGKHTLWAYCHVPNGYTGDMTGPIEDQIERFAPGFRDRVLARSAMGPQRMEQWNANLVGGDIAGGASDWRQLAGRPVLSLRPYATPDPRVWLCSSSTPPGGGGHGMCGWNAAGAVLARHGGRRPPVPPGAAETSALRSAQTGP